MNEDRQKRTGLPHQGQGRGIYHWLSDDNRVGSTGRIAEFTGERLLSENARRARSRTHVLCGGLLPKRNSQRERQPAGVGD